MSATDRNWVDLPPELLGSIAERLTVAEYIRFAAVCSSWGSVASRQDRLFLPLAPAMPLLLLPGQEGERGGSCTLFSFPDWRHHRLAPIPEMRGKWCVGSQYGWLALLDELSEVSLLNPLTRSQIHLPSILTIPGVDAVYNSGSSISEFRYTPRMDRDWVFPYAPASFRLFGSFKKVVLSARPTAGSYTAMAIFSLKNSPAFATACGGSWTLLRTGPGLSDIIYRDGKFLAISDKGQLWAFDIAGPSPQMTMIAPGCADQCNVYDMHLVVSSGDLLQVWRYTSDREDHDEIMTTIDFKVLRFVPEQATWVPLKSLGNNSLFLGLSYSISLSAREVSKLKPNCIYFTEVLWMSPSEDDTDRIMTRDVGVFSLEDGSFDRYCPTDPRLNWPPPIWIAPSLL